MPWISENNNEYWMPDVLPEPTEEHQELQSNKRYLTQAGKERLHPGWTYAETIAYVDDEYLFQNEGWKVIIDESPSISEDDLKHASRNNPDTWEQLDEKTVKVTYTIIDFTQDEVDQYLEKKWNNVRTRRDELLSKTDWIITRAYEENLIVSQEVTLYRQQLRDFPQTIANILEFNINDDSMWPIKPEVYFEV